jgi:HEPN domain-containing protein
MERALDWFKQAQNDLQWARHTFDGGFFAQACFAAQQAAEKGVKALIEHQHGRGWGHSITHLLKEALRAEEIDSEVMTGALELDQYYVTSRYPNGFAAGAPLEFFTRAQAKRALQHAQKIIDFCNGRIC